MSWTVTAEGPSDHPVDWPALRAEILSKLDVRAEYVALGARFVVQTPNSKGILRCHALGREDSNPSAMVNVRSGVYHDSGSGESLSLWDAALKFGPALGRHIDVLRHYGEKAGVPVPTPHYHSGGRIREAEYDYRAEDGSPLFRVFRYRLPSGGKSFSQHPPDGKGGWKLGPGCMDGVRLVPYRLPELLASVEAGSPAWIVEGEKDAERLAAHGLIATCNPMGAGKWRDEFATYFAGRDCYILPDNDTTGRRHAQVVAASLKPVVRSVKIVELPDLPVKGDVSDWLDAGGTVEELGRLAGAAPDWEPPSVDAPEEGPARRPATLADLRLSFTGTRWIWPGWIPSGRISGLAATEGCGKTRLMLDLARRIWHGLPWPDGHESTFPANTPTLWLCADGNQDDLAEAVLSYGLPDEAVFFNTVPDDIYGGTDLDAIETLATLDEFIPLVRPAFVVIDSLTFATRRDLCRQSDVQVLLTPLKLLAQKHQVAIIPQLHISREGSVLGRRSRGLTRTLIKLEANDPDVQPDRRRLWVDKSFDKKPPPLGVTMTDRGNEYDGDAPPPLAPAAPRNPGRPSAESERARKFILDALRLADRRLTEVKNEFLGSGGSERTFWRARDDLVTAGEITCDGTPKILHLVNGHEATNGVPF